MSTLIVRTGVDSRFLENVITRDISTQASVFDLVDNAIDAAKEHLNNEGTISLDEYGLPDNYNGFKIYIRLDKDSFKIIDNCFGIPDTTLKNDMLMVGKESNHDYGLGKYGIGLKRALLKFGTNYSLFTDTSTYAIKMQFNNFDFGDSRDLEANKTRSRGKRKTLFIVSKLKGLVKKEFQNEEWLKKLKNELSDRYGIFIKKGLQIKIKPINSKPILIKERFPVITTHPHIPSILCPTPIDFMGVNVFIEYGLHKNYNVGGGYGVNDLANISEFGWYVICNDRVIEIAKRDGSDYGWSRNWHNEYNGFIGLIRFNCQDVSLLPWDSTKTKITTDSLVFLEIKNSLAEMALKFRSDKKRFIKFVKDNKLNTSTTSLPNNPLPSKSSALPSEANKSNAGIKGEKKPIGKTTKHTQQWNTLLPENFHQPNNDWILNNLIIEAKKIVIKSFPHASSLLYRSLIEETLLVFIKNSNKYDEVIEHFYSVGEGKRKSHSQETKDNQGISLAMASHWLLDHPEYFPKDEKNKLRNATGRLRNHVKTLNNVVHCKHIMTDIELAAIRTQTFPLLEFLVISFNEK
ncbi:hypothetical protein GCM10027361_34490 [Erwinia aphidicola]|uniref:ATP-binding protein n=1 Tax=Erwinia aphidicola TaxID=68334 RepID=UPI0017469002|nr:ATP-binding protein [Erwinia aphidicola]MBD1376175.1 ATP-binding protein [Erwinia aphidicola]